MNKKMISIIVIIISLINLIAVSSYAAVPINSAYIYANKRTEVLLLRSGVEIYADMAVYSKDGKEYPAYCLNRGVYGVELGFSQTVEVSDLVNNVMVWRAITNGYPYKSITELGCQTEEEAYLATKQAIYCVIDNIDVNRYTAVGESGQRTLNALKQILEKAKKSTSIKVSSELKINQENSLWKVDELDNRYVYQMFSVSANSGFDKYKIELENKKIEGIKVTDENNNEKNEFSSNEKFKILIPITSIIEDGDLIIKTSGKVKTKPVLYGKSYDPALQNYALTGYTYEDGTGSQKIYYTKNETKIVINKKDSTGETKLQGVEFELLDENKNALFTGLTTNENGQIEINNLVPGTYYLKETRTLEGYEIYDKLIKIELNLNEEVTVNVINEEEKPDIEAEKNKSEITVENSKSKLEVKLPKTGM